MSQPPEPLSYSAPTPPLQNLGLLTLLLMCVLGISLILLIAGALGGLMLAHVWSLYQEGKTWNPTEMDAGNLLQTIYAFAILWSFLLTTVVLMAWMYQSQKDLQRFTKLQLRFTPIKAILNWIVPYWTVIRPYEMMRELFARSRGESIRRFRPMIGCWWAFWLLAHVVALFGTVAISSQRRMNQEDRIIAQCLLQAAYTLFYFVSGCLLLIVVYKIDRAQAKQENIPLAS